MQPYFSTNLGTLYHCDCFDVLSQIPSGSVDMILCDLPYGTTRLPWDKRLPLGPLWQEYLRLTKERGVIALTAQQPFATDLIVEGRKIFRYELIWEKSLALGFLNARRMPLRAHENILIFYRKLPVYNPQMVKGSRYKRKPGPKRASLYGTIRQKGGLATKTDERFPRSVLRFSRSKGHGHPTEKPLELFQWIIRTYTDTGDMVLDNCVGSGTTAVAAESLERRWIAIEKEASYCDMTKRRLENYGRDGS